MTSTSGLDLNTNNSVSYGIFTKERNKKSKDVRKCAIEEKMRNIMSLLAESIGD